MATFVKTILQINASKEQVEEILNFVKSENSEFDFKKIIPMPEELNIVSGGPTEIGLEYYALLRKREKGSGFFVSQVKDAIEAIEGEENFEEIKDLGKKAWLNLINYGYTTWLGWCVEYWGTKWNASEVEIKDNVISFETAWACPTKVLIALSKKFNTIKFSFKYASEDLGTSSYIGTISDGIMTESPDTPKTENEKKKFAIKLWGLQDEFDSATFGYPEKDD